MREKGSPRSRRRGSQATFRAAAVFAAAAALTGAMLLLAGCGENGAERLELDLPEPDGAFIFYRMADYSTTDYGLVSADGEILMPMEYPQIRIVRDAPLTGTKFARSDESRFFMAAQGKEVTGDEEEREMLLYALVSPQGERLTDFLYYDMCWYGDEFGAVKYGSDGRAETVMLDQQGREFAVNDMEIWADMEEHRQSADYVYGMEQSFYLKPEGRDVPETGFQKMTFLKDGRYWGTTYGRDEQRRARLFTADGTLEEAPEYSDVVKLSDRIWLAFDYGKDGFDSVASLIREDGTPVNGEYYNRIDTWKTDRYLLARMYETYYVLDGETGEAVVTVEEGKNADLILKNGIQHLAVGGQGKKDASEEPPYVVNMETMEKVVFEDFPGGRIDDADWENNAYVIYCEMSGIPAPEHKKGMEQMGRSYFLVNGEGEVLNSYGYFFPCYDSYYFNMYYTMNARLKTINHTGLYDSRGREILPPEYSSLHQLDGYALFAEQGDYRGIIDLKGNWIYRESKYVRLED